MVNIALTHFSSVSKLCVLVNTTSDSVLSLFDIVGDLMFLSFSSSPRVHARETTD